MLLCTDLGSLMYIKDPNAPRSDWSFWKRKDRPPVMWNDGSEMLDVLRCFADVPDESLLGKQGHCNCFSYPIKLGGLAPEDNLQSILQQRYSLQRYALLSQAASV